jgi:hypothetical protein
MDKGMILWRRRLAGGFSDPYHTAKTAGETPTLQHRRRPADFHIFIENFLQD